MDLSFKNLLPEQVWGISHAPAHSDNVWKIALKETCHFAFLLHPFFILRGSGIAKKSRCYKVSYKLNLF